MKIALVGYGKMGHMLARAASLRGHDVVCTVDPFAEDASVVTGDVKAMADAIVKSGAEGVIEFSHPTSVLANIRALVPTGIPLVVGTTGWQGELESVKALVAEHGSPFLYSSNFSVGVNLFYRMVSNAARLMAQFEEYDVALFEAHHNQKADSPSGTSLDVARRVMAEMPRKTTLITDPFTRRPEPQELHLASLRVGSVPGTHTVFFDSSADTIELTHTARNREGLALGAVRALEWLSAQDGGKLKKGVFTMNDVFDSL
ncbi:MAG TPA: 4-hydroxy-tetrahydrodipicolinate reductase [Treponemataceae bacterium]|nr:4-hydroxy-tetrahydrodipicolinate reductase [Treponemataceae bacterium]